MLMGLTAPANAHLSTDTGRPSVSISTHLATFPKLIPVPGYPVYYAPQLHSNFFFYDGMYWVYKEGGWYASSWYNGPWIYVMPEAVPLFVLRIPVRYYQRPPVYFRSWRADAPPHWGEHWGNKWEQRRRGWNRWDHHAAPALAPLPIYQQQYSGNRYPQMRRQQALQKRNYRYQPHDGMVRQHYQQQGHANSIAPQPRGRAPEH